MSRGEKDTCAPLGDNGRGTIPEDFGIMIRTVYGDIGIPQTTYRTLEGLLRARACQDRWEEQNVVYVCREEEDNDIYDGGNEA